MTDPASIFREEALRHRAGGSGPGEVLRVSPRWASRAYWALLVLVAAGLTWSALARAAEVARGPAVVRGQAVVAVVPAAFAPQLRAGMTLTLTLPGRAPAAVAVRSAGPVVASTGAASRLLGTDVSRAGLAPGPLLIVRAAAPPGAPGRAVGGASIQVRSDRLLVTLVPGLRSLLGGGGG